MNLLVANNLNDVQSIFKSRINLLLKDCANFDSNNVNITGGNIAIDFFKLNFYDSNNDIFVQCSNDDGVLVLNYDNQSNIPKWLRKDTKDINVTIFNNDISAITYNSLCNIVLTNDFNDCVIKPYLWDYLDSNNFAKIENSLSDIYNINQFYNQLNLSLFAKCNLQPNMEFDNINLDKFALPFIKNQNGLLDDSYNNIFDINSIPLTSTSQFGIALLKSEPNSLTDTISSYFLNNIFTDLYGIYSQKNINYQCNVQQVIQYVIDNKDVYANFTCNFTDMDTTKVRKNLEMDKLLNKLVVHDDYIDFTDLIVKFNQTSYNNLLNLELVNQINNKYVNIEDPINVRSYHHFFIYIKDGVVDLTQDTWNIDLTNNDLDLSFLISSETIEYSDYPHTSESNLGITYINHSYANYVLNSNDRHNTFTLDLFRNFTNQHLAKLDSVVDIIDFQSFLNELYETGVDNGSNLMRFTCNLEEVSFFDLERRKLCYKNLQLEPIVYTSEYSLLFNKPNNVSCFSNDCEYLSMYNNFKEFVNDEEKSFVRSNLQVGTLGVQNIDNVDMYGSNLNMAFLTVISTLTYTNNYVEDSYIYSSNSNGVIVWKKLPEYDRVHDEKGILYMYNQMVFDDNGTYTIQLLNTVYNELIDILNIKRAELSEILNHSNYLNYYSLNLNGVSSS